MENELAHRLIKARSGHGWSQADLSEVSGVAAAQISRYESGRAKPRPEVVAKLAKSLAVGFEWLLDGRGNIDDGSTIPQYPKRMFSNPPLELEDEFHEALSRFAKSEGITIEMAMRAIFLQAVETVKEHPERLEQIVRQIKKPKP